jgi:cytochrome o ubiquinol oxidase operon protein cyoD
MSKQSSKSDAHGSVSSYVEGFAWSLLLTFIPYYLVSSQSIKGTRLVVTILAFAVLQMIVQVTYFLHLGRGPKQRWNLFFFIATVGIVLVVVSGSVVIINNLHYNMTPLDQSKKLANNEGIYQVGGEKTGACTGRHSNHKVKIGNGQVSPRHTNAQKCDTLTFINDAVAPPELTFGNYPHHEAYAGEIKLTIRKGMNKTITLSESGSYQFYDYIQKAAVGDFTVTP